MIIGIAIIILGLLNVIIWSIDPDVLGLFEAYVILINLPTILVFIIFSINENRYTQLFSYLIALKLIVGMILSIIKLFNKEHGIITTTTQIILLILISVSVIATRKRFTNILLCSAFCCFNAIIILDYIQVISLSKIIFSLVSMTLFSIMAMYKIIENRKVASYNENEAT